jgi:hypothetical protein
MTPGQAGTAMAAGYRGCPIPLMLDGEPYPCPRRWGHRGGHDFAATAQAAAVSDAEITHHYETVVSGLRAELAAASGLAAELDRLRSQLAEAAADHAELLEEILKHAEDEPGAEYESAEVNAVEYVRFLEGQLAELRARREEVSDAGEVILRDNAQLRELLAEILASPWVQARVPDRVRDAWVRRAELDEARPRYGCAAAVIVLAVAAAAWAAAMYEKTLPAAR